MMRYAIFALMFLIMACLNPLQAQAKKEIRSKKKSPISVMKKTQPKTNAQVPLAKPLITFYELGSVKCIPCRQMQPVMKSIEQKYGEQIKVVFYDVWKEDQKHYAEEFGIQLIPTQVFVDEKGKEIKRHEGFFPEKDIDAFLESKGLKPKGSPQG